MITLAIKIWIKKTLWNSLHKYKKTMFNLIHRLIKQFMYTKGTKCNIIKEI